MYLYIKLALCLALLTDKLSQRNVRVKKKSRTSIIARFGDNSDSTILKFFKFLTKLLFLVVFIHMSKINSFFKRPSGPSTSNTSASGDDDLEPPKNKSLKSESNRGNTAYLKTVEN